MREVAGLRRSTAADWFAAALRLVAL